MGVDGVVTERPEETAGVKGQRFAAKRPGHRRESQQRAPVEGDAEKGLGPVGDALHEGVGEDEHQRSGAKGDGEAIEAQQYAERGHKLKDEEYLRAGHRDRARGHRPGAGARHLRVEIPVDDVVEGAPRPAHDDGADAEKKEEGHGAVRVADARARQDDAPPGRQEQKPGADGPVYPRQLEIGPDRPRQVTFDPMIRRHVRRCGFGGLHHGVVLASWR